MLSESEPESQLTESEEEQVQVQGASSNGPVARRLTTGGTDECAPACRAIPSPELHSAAIDASSRFEPSAPASGSENGCRQIGCAASGSLAALGGGAWTCNIGGTDMCCAASCWAPYVPPETASLRESHVYESETGRRCCDFVKVTDNARLPSDSGNNYRNEAVPQSGSCSSDGCKEPGNVRRNWFRSDFGSSTSAATRNRCAEKTSACKCRFRNDEWSTSTAMCANQCPPGRGLGCSLTPHSTGGGNDVGVAWYARVAPGASRYYPPTDYSNPSYWDGNPLGASDLYVALPHRDGI